MAMDDTQTGTAGSHNLDVGNALDRGEIDVHFQPKVDLRNGRVIGVEALARWEHSEFGLLPAAEFIHTIESDAEMRSLTERVIGISAQAGGDWTRFSWTRSSSRSDWRPSLSSAAASPSTTSGRGTSPYDS